MREGCKNCMNHKPAPGAQTFICPECGWKWGLANCFPGNYWEPHYPTKGLTEHNSKDREHLSVGSKPKNGCATVGE